MMQVLDTTSRFPAVQKIVMFNEKFGKYVHLEPTKKSTLYDDPNLDDTT
jgi:hypothetical protein